MRLFLSCRLASRPLVPRLLPHSHMALFFFFDMFTLFSLPPAASERICSAHIPHCALNRHPPFPSFSCLMLCTLSSCVYTFSFAYPSSVGHGAFLLLPVLCLLISLPLCCASYVCTTVDVHECLSFPTFRCPPPTESEGVNANTI